MRSKKKVTPKPQYCVRGWNFIHLFACVFAIGFACGCCFSFVRLFSFSNFLFSSLFSRLFFSFFIFLKKILFPYLLLFFNCLFFIPFFLSFSIYFSSLFVFIDIMLKLQQILQHFCRLYLQIDVQFCIVCNIFWISSLLSMVFLWEAFFTRCWDTNFVFGFFKSNNLHQQFPPTIVCMCVFIFFASSVWGNNILQCSSILWCCSYF